MSIRFPLRQAIRKALYDHDHTRGLTARDIAQVNPYRYGLDHWPKPPSIAQVLRAMEALGVVEWAGAEGYPLTTQRYRLAE